MSIIDWLMFLIFFGLASFVILNVWIAVTIFRWMFVRPRESESECSQAKVIA